MANSTWTAIKTTTKAIALTHMSQIILSMTVSLTMVAAAAVSAAAAVVIMWTMTATTTLTTSMTAAAVVMKMSVPMMHTIANNSSDNDGDVASHYYK